MDPGQRIWRLIRSNKDWLKEQSNKEEEARDLTSLAYKGTRCVRDSCSTVSGKVVKLVLFPVGGYDIIILYICVYI